MMRINDNLNKKLKIAVDQNNKIIAEINEINLLVLTEKRNSA